MEKTLQVLNGMERTGVIRRYAIGGAVVAIFYMEPVLTYGLDIFVELPAAGSGLLSLSQVCDYLRAQGYAEERECVNIEGVPVQFLPAFNPLIKEAVAEARDTTFEQTPTRVLRAEHLVAIMLQTGCNKDRERLASFLAERKARRQWLALCPFPKKFGPWSGYRPWPRRFSARKGAPCAPGGWKPQSPDWMSGGERDSVG